MKSDLQLAFNLDSIFRPRDTVPPLQRTSPFAGHELGVQDGEWIRRSVTSDDFWLFGILLGVTVLLLLFLRARRIKIGLLFRACITQRQLDILVRTCNLSRFHHVLLSTAYFSLVVCVMAYHILVYRVETSLTSIPVVDYLLMVLLLLVACLIRQAVTLMLGNTFCDDDAIRFYISNTQVFLMVDTVVLLPLVTLICFSPIGHIAVTIALSVLALMLAIRIIRGMEIVLSTAKNSKFYLFSYLCIVEIVPLLVIAKLAIG